MEKAAVSRQATSASGDADESVLKLNQGAAHPDSAAETTPRCPHAVAALDIGIVARMRQGIPYLSALPADAVPTASALRAALGPGRLEALAIRLGDDGEALDPALCPTQGRPPARDLAAAIACQEATSADLHDAYFAVQRAAPTELAAHPEAILAAAATLRAEARLGAWRVEAACFDQIARGLERSFRIATGLDPAPIRLAPRAGPAVLDAALAARRWMRGHQIFLVLTQAMLATLAPLRHRAEPAAVGPALAALGPLLEASAAAMRLTGDFDPRHYDDVIRPSMAPPAMPPGFSGLYSSDHRQLIGLLRETGPLLRGAAAPLPEAHAALLAGFTAIYDDHKAVCSHFVGVDRGSLLMGGQEMGNAVEQLEKFKRSRLFILAPR